MPHDHNHPMNGYDHVTKRPARSAPAVTDWPRDYRHGADAWQAMRAAERAAASRRHRRNLAIMAIICCGAWAAALVIIVRGL
jgi:hypothetical protein